MAKDTTPKPTKTDQTKPEPRERDSWDSWPKLPGEDLLGPPKR